MGRPSIPPEMLLKALLLQALYSIRSERQLVEQIQMNLLYKWFIDLSVLPGTQIRTVAFVHLSWGYVVVPMGAQYGELAEPAVIPR